MLSGPASAVRHTSGTLHAERLPVRHARISKVFRAAVRAAAACRCARCTTVPFLFVLKSRDGAAWGPSGQTGLRRSETFENNVMWGHKQVKPRLSAPGAGRRARRARERPQRLTRRSSLPRASDRPRAHSTPSILSSTFM